MDNTGMPSSFIDHAVAVNIRSALERDGRSAYEISYRLGHSHNWLYRIINCKKGIPYDRLRALAHELGVTAGSLVATPDDWNAQQIESPAAPVPFHLQTVAAGTTDGGDDGPTRQRTASDRFSADLGKRVQKARERIGLNRDGSTARAGASGGQPDHAAIEAGNPEASLHRLVELAPALGVSLDWLLGLTDEPAVFGVSIVPVYPEPVAAGERGRDVVVPDLGIPHCFSRQRLASDGIDPKQAGVFLVAGESMVPTLADGGRVLVDKQRTEPKDNCLFVIAYGDDLLVKRYVARPGPFWKSDNEAFKPIPHNGSITVQGQVRWSMRRFGDEGH